MGLNFCPPKPGFDRHQQHHVAQGQQGDDGVHRRAGLDGYRRLDTLRADKAEDFGAVGGDFLMNRDGGRACLAEGFDVFFGLVEHEMDVERDGEALDGALSQRWG